MNYSHYQIIGPNGISSVDNSLHITSYSSMNEGKYVCTAAGLEEQTSINLVSPLSMRAKYFMHLIVICVFSFI